MVITDWINKWLIKKITKFWVWVQGCNGWTGEDPKCGSCPAYNPNNTHCDE